KSYFARWLAYYIGHLYPVVYVMTKTKSNHWWSQCVSDSYIFEGWQPHIVAELMKRNEKILSVRGMSKHVDPNILLILDDIIGEDSFKNDHVLKDIFTLGRHKRIGLIVLTQDVFGISTVARGNCDYVVSTLQMQNRQREAIAKDYGDIIHRQSFYDMMDDNTRDNSMLVIDLSLNTPDPSKVFFTAKANNPGPFRLGDDKCWSANEKQLQQVKDISDNSVRLESGWDTAEDQKQRRAAGGGNDDPNKQQQSKDTEMVQVKQATKKRSRKNLEKHNNPHLDDVVVGGGGVMRDKATVSPAAATTKRIRMDSA
ncbi:hypothetical protein SAMD00019534_125660, partial [Acytostelium subglobosum LB1]|uniref:hypothetical protein n=1 Tax=Acytostelium subglobosum LB1 TaxID=1410327 RepID=UPI000644BE32